MKVLRGERRRIASLGVAVGACLLVLAAGAIAADPPTVSVSDASAPEGQPLEFTISLSAVAEADVTVTVNTSGGSGYTSVTDELVTIPAGETEVPFEVQTAAGDDLDEPDSEFQITLSNPAGATDGDMTGQGTIVDDDATPTLAISGPAPVTEGNAGTTNAAYSVTMTGKSAATVTVSYATANGTATAGSDYDERKSPPQLSWSPGETGSKPIIVPVRGDTLDEFNETFSVNLSGASNATVAAGTATTTITDDDAETTVTEVTDVTVTESKTATVEATITVTIGPSGKTVTVPWSTAPISATENVDYVHKSGALVFESGDPRSKTITVEVKPDTLFEGPEKFQVVLTDPTNGAPGPKMRGEITISDAETSAPAPTLNAPSVIEGNSGLTDLVFEAQLDGPHPALRFNYRTVTDTANGSDYQHPTTGFKDFPKNDSSTPTKVPITIKVTGDTLDEVNETMKLELLDNNDVVVRSAVGTIENDDNNSALSVADAEGDEPASGTGKITFKLSLSQASGRTVSVRWATANGTATAGVDYTAASGTATFAPGVTSVDVDVNVIGDTIDEENETLELRLSNPEGVPASKLVDADALGTIVDKNASPSLSISDTVTREGEGALLTVSLAGTTTRTVTVRFVTREGFAKSDDFLARVGTLTFAPGEKTKSIEISIVDDNVAEPTEDFSVSLDDAVNALITKGTGRVTIEASDQGASAPAPSTPSPPSGGQSPVTNPPASTPAPTATPAGKTGTKRILSPRMVLGPRTMKVDSAGVVRITVACQRTSPIACAGSVELERVAKPLLKAGKRGFAVAKGRTGVAPLKLTSRALTVLRKKGTLRVRVLVTYKKSVGTGKVVPGVVTLSAPKVFSKAATSKPKQSEAPTKVEVGP